MQDSSDFKISLLSPIWVSDARQELAHAPIRHDLKDSQFGLLPRI